MRLLFLAFIALTLLASCEKNEAIVLAPTPEEQWELEFSFPYQGAMRSFKMTSWKIGRLVEYDQRTRTNVLVGRILSFSDSFDMNVELTYSFGNSDTDLSGYYKRVAFSNGGNGRIIGFCDGPQGVRLLSYNLRRIR